MAPQAKDGGRGNRVHPTPVFIGNWFTTKLFYSKQQFHVLSLLSLLWLVLPITRYYILFGVEKIVNKEFMNDYMVQLRVAKNGKELDKIVFKAIGDDSNYLNYKITNGKGLKNVKNIIKISFLVDICEYPDGCVYILWTGKKLMMLKNNTKPYTGYFSYDAQLIFPTDKEGKTGKVIVIETDNFETENSHKKPKTTTTVLKWDGAKVN